MTISKKIKQANYKRFINDLRKVPANSKKINQQIIKIATGKNKRNRIKKFDFMNEIVNVATELYPRTSPNCKYTHRELLTCIIHFADTHISWKKYRGTKKSLKRFFTPEIKISGKYLNAVHLKYVTKGVYSAINKKLLEIYLKNNKCAKLKYQSIDSSFIPNKKGIHKIDNNLPCP